MGVTTPKADPLAIARFNSRSHTESDTADTLNSLQYNFNSHSNTGVTERSNINEQTNFNSHSYTGVTKGNPHKNQDICYITCFFPTL